MTTSLDALRISCDRSWPAIAKAGAATKSTLCCIRDELENVGSELFRSSDVSLVVFGSLARDEYTSKSDVDWVLLVDGQTKLEHREFANEVTKVLKKMDLPAPSPQGRFGRLLSSHEIIHQIGGEHDTNINLSLRLLLLLESRSLDITVVRDRVLRSVLEKYLIEDASFRTTTGQIKKVPRFLFNDVVRYWRTLAVDYAHKRVENAPKSVLRNLKLRMSRKLIFIKGMLTCFNCSLDPSQATEDMQFDFGPINRWVEPLINQLTSYVNTTPLELLADTLQRRCPRIEITQSILDSYDSFLALLDKDDIRQELEKLSIDAAQKNSRFQDIRELTHAFQKGVEHLFFEGDTALVQLTRKYGVF